MIVHVAIILLLALIPLHDQIGRSISSFAGFGGGEEGTEDSLASFDLESQALADDAAGELVSMEVALAPSETPLPTLNNDAVKALDLGTPGAIRNGLSGRSGSMKGALLAAYGGTAGTEDAVAAGLAWLARNQLSDGSWSLEGPYSDGSVNENKSSATAMALLAFMGAGNTHKSGEYSDRVARGIQFLMREQDKDGFFASRAVGNQRTYAQAQCTIAFCELFGMTGSSEIREPAERAIKYAVASQDDLGGWRYQPRQSGDTSVTGWYVMALVSARMAGLQVDSDALERVNRFLDTVQRSVGQRKPDKDGEAYSYQGYSAPTVTMTSEGMLCRLYLGWKTTDPRITNGTEILLREPIRIDPQSRNYYYWYYATTTLHHIGGSPWRTWNEVMKVRLPQLQTPSGKEKGSWTPDGDPHGAAGGRLYSTCLALYCLESYYRHLPLSDMASH